MAAERDDGLDKLEAFVAGLKSTTEQLKGQINEIEAHDHELDALQEERVANLVETLARITQEVGRAEGEATQGLESVAQAGEQIGGDGLGQAESEVERTGTDFEQELDEARGTLDQHYGELEGSGFDEIDGTLEDERGQVETLGQGNDEAFSELEGGLDEQQSHAEEALGDASSGLEEVEHALSGGESSELESDGAAVAEGLAQLPEALQNGCDEAATAAGESYDTFQGDGTTAGDNLIETVRTVAQEAAEAIAEQGSTLGEETTTVSQALTQLDDEAALMETVIEAGGQTADALTPIVEELVVAQGKVDTIDELLDAIS